VLAWGRNDYGQADVPPGLSNVVGVAAGGEHSLALQGNGRVVAWGHGDRGQTNVPSNLRDVVAIAAGDAHSTALNRNGTVVQWGQFLDPSGNGSSAGSPSRATNVLVVASGGNHTLALLAGGPIQPVPLDFLTRSLEGPVFTASVPTIRGQHYLLEHARSPQATNWIMCTPIPGDGAIKTLVDPEAIVAQRFYRVRLRPGVQIANAFSPQLLSPCCDGTTFSALVLTVVGQSYVLEFKDSLTQSSWSALAPVDGNGALITLIDPSPSTSQRFYRVRVQQ
jgi:hypothetical protein